MTSHWYTRCSTPYYLQSSTAIYTATATTYPNILTFVDLDVDTVNCGRYSRKKKTVIKEYAKRVHTFKETYGECKSITAKIIDQTIAVENLNERIESMSPVTMPSDGGPGYTETMSLIQDGNAALSDLQNQQIICDRQHYSEYEKLRLAEESLARKFFGGFRVNSGLVSEERMMDLLTSQIFLNCFGKFHIDIRSSSMDSERASTSGTQGSSPQPQGPPPSYGVVMRKPKLYKVTQQNPGDQPPSYQEVIRNPQKFPKFILLKHLPVFHPVNIQLHPLYGEFHPLYRELHPVYGEFHLVCEELHPLYRELHPVYGELHLVCEKFHPVLHGKSIVLESVLR
ncbi:hypothetical protein BATDEDRAFT_28975 [Batrachochytrium dendrobatidis JAM81]|uniref:Uncharacterized protein n=1 Tax=Batrachochytrium dendrobatidis (strain JAM81 / FGSC 10211) TaxID=684364 RepID=F4PFT7_BATDJ|nr:uncharacterized protein BATDEDRAFT_28975 [Batrachochytrium dendrobatidis JAM81]EGF75906.1 hypothetical protein BATDEDRAFT_28975 [Batrachochytrium dendrobatidis JAM81]|eukprot:XP_006683470.1 hypothetical protein BATDEDRAFT_28975 [Batrachochytrium dendrobatidis JAM81]